MKRRFRSARCPFTTELCYLDRSLCAKCERRVRSGQKTLFECASKPVAGKRYEGKVGRRWRKPSRALESVGLPPVKPIAFPTPKTPDLAPRAGLCRECGEAVSTGSTLWFVCPLDGAWRSPGDPCRFAGVFEGTYGRGPSPTELRVFIQYITLARASQIPASRKNRAKTNPFMPSKGR